MSRTNVQKCFAGRGFSHIIGTKATGNSLTRTALRDRIMQTQNAGVVELADTLDLGSNG